MSLGWIILLSAIVLLAIIVGSCWYMAAMMNIIFIRKHVEIDEVLSSGQPPEAWQKRYLIKLVRLQNKGASEEKITRLTRRQQKHNITGLARLARYVRKTNLVEDESARSNTLSQLEQCRQQCELEGKTAKWHMTESIKDTH
jgi:hypothetical protein